LVCKYLFFSLKAIIIFPYHTYTSRKAAATVSRHSAAGQSFIEM